MKELRLTNDFMFKALFVHEKEKGERLLKSLLEAILKKPINSVVIKNNELLGASEPSKDIRLDISCMVDGTFVDLEMQMINDSRQLPDRMAFYGARALAEQEDKGVTYDKIVPIECIFLMGRNVTKSEKSNYQYKIMEVDDLQILTNKFSIRMIEIDKIAKRWNADTSDLLCDWCYFLVNGGCESDDPALEEILSGNKVFQEGIEIMEKVGNDPLLRDRAFARLKNEWDEFAFRESARIQGLEEGRAEGLVQGKAEGLAQGKAEGLAQGKAEGLVLGKEEGIAEGIAEAKMDYREKLKSAVAQGALTKEQVKQLFDVDLDE